MEKTKEKVEMEVTDPHAPRQLTLAQNVILTVKVLAVLGVIFAVLWGINTWTTAS
ncbi:MAG TPA: hypothetical protein VGH38_23740 [Bryobacteraceae bacterium]|jgi:hypothetical protein